MQRKPFPSETQERFIVRFPDGMRDRIAEAAKLNNRSMNAEIVARLEATFAGNGESAQLPALVEDVAKEFMENSHINRPEALEAMAVKAQNAKGPVLIIHHAPGINLGDMRSVLQHLGDGLPADAAVYVYPPIK